MKMMLALLLFVLGFTLAWSQTCEYAQYSPTHTMCDFRGPGCPLLGSGLSQQDIDLIVDTHNKLRSKVATGQQPGQPSAANMKQLVWDYELAEIAQRNIERCLPSNVNPHDKGDDRRSHKYASVGQNVGYIYGNDPIEHPDYQKHVENWFNKEVGNMDPRFIKSFPHPLPDHLGHYTQLVWADTESVGCGAVYVNTEGYYQTRLACNYGPAGNVDTWPIYVEGEPCTQCPNGCSNQYDGLCA